MARWTKCGEGRGRQTCSGKCYFGGQLTGGPKESSRVQHCLSGGGFQCSLREWMRSFHAQQGHRPCLCCWGITESLFSDVNHASVFDWKGLWCSKVGYNTPCWSSACHFWFIQLFEVNILVALHHGLNRLTCLPSIDGKTLTGDVFHFQVAFHILICGDIVEWDRAG